MPAGTTISVPEHIKKVPPAVRPMVQAARAAIRAVAPKAEEVGYPAGPPRSAGYMWKIARYRLNGGNVVGIGTFPGHSNLFFYRGRELDDGSGLLEGGGKEMRFIKLESRADLDKAAVHRVLRRAFKLGPA